MLKGLVFVSLIACAIAEDKYMSAIATRSTKVEGHLRCGVEPLANVHVRLFRTASEDLNEVISSGKTDDKGRFSVEGDTSRFEGDQSAIDPYLRIYHKCDEEETKSGYRRVELRYPREFVTLGRVPRRTFNIGILNMEVIYPNEKRQKVLEGVN
ncbi:Trans-thyretin-related family domain family member [Aphelenchoides besseyi]|nr:Trans-thyretin-related family domain family member [Aphelenchoides besseyi]KAI6194456.1 Trans-thyretin-related family domain family member [Aphelenchoides besseyi]